MASHLKEFIYLFDIDGTLLHIKENIIRPMLDDILKKYDVHIDDIHGVSLAGRTDYDIFNTFIDGMENQSELFEELKEEYIHSLEQLLDEKHIEVFSGVRSCLDILAETGAHVGLLTGNFKRSGFNKLRIAGIAEHFHFGGFGEQHRNRNDLPSLAFSNYFEYSEIEADPSQFIVIGDTPKDIQCAKFGGAKSVAVTTGFYSHHELASHQPDLIIDSLENPEQWTKNLS